MKYFVCTIFCFLFTQSWGQSLGRERVEMLDKTVVAIKINEQITGTGFVASSNGWIITNLHVIRNNVKQDGSLFHPIFVEFRSGEKYQVEILQMEAKNYVKYDYCILFPIDMEIKNREYLKIGRWNDIREGDEIYSSGFPFGIDKNVKTKGIVGNKFVEEYDLQILDDSVKVKREVALLDLTMNKGNSGGPILKLGKTPEEDVVVGIATFIVVPFLQELNEISALTDGVKNGVTISYSNGQEVNSFEMYSKFSKILKFQSNGIGGCIAIDYLSDFFK